MISVVLISVVVPVVAQTPPGTWVPVDDLPEGMGRYDDISFSDARHGWTVKSGILFGTSDGGETWSRLFDSNEEPEGGVYFRSVAFADAQRGWLGSLDPGRVLWETTDGGQTATDITDRISGAMPSGLCGMWVVDSLTVVAAGQFFDDPVIVKTTDGGQTWTSQDLSALVGGLTDVYFFDADRGIAAGRIYDGEDIRVGVIGTEDGGATWTLRAQSSGTDEWAWKISFPTPETGYISVQSFETAKVMKTQDGGQTWAELPLGVPGVTGLSAIGFTSETVGWTAGWPTEDIQFTEDGGATWTPAPLGDDSVVNRIRFYEFDGQTIGFGGGGAFYRYVPGGTSTVADSPGETRARLGGNFPNPFEAHTLIPFWLHQPSAVRLTIYDTLGRHVRTLVDEVRSPGQHQAVWDGTDESSRGVAAGVYLYQLEAGATVQSGKAVVLR